MCCNRYTRCVTLALGAFLVVIWLFGASLGAEPEKQITSRIGMKLVLIPAGEFMMGNGEGRTVTLTNFPSANPESVDAELPCHKVRITRAFYMGQYTVTLNEFLMFYHDAQYKLEIERDGNPSFGHVGGVIVFDKSANFRPWAPGWEIGKDNPAVLVSWNDAVAFCDWLSKKEGKTYRLPTEAEWEYACRAGASSRYCFGNDPEELVKHANVADQDFAKLFSSGYVRIRTSAPGLGEASSETGLSFLDRRDGYAWTAPVGKFRSNAFGLYDMHGNVWQWCSDFYDERYYGNSPADDPKGPSAGSARVIRGGSFMSPPVELRCAVRGAVDPSDRHCQFGFRVVCER